LRATDSFHCRFPHPFHGEPARVLRCAIVLKPSTLLHLDLEAKLLYFQLS